MSGKYANVRAAYTPLNEEDPRGELLFKMTFDMEERSLTYRKVTDSIATDFFGGRGGWSGSSNPKQEIAFGLCNSEVQLDLYEQNAYGAWDQAAGGMNGQLPQADAEKAAKFIFNSMQTLANAPDTNENNLMKKLYDAVYTVQEMQADGNWEHVKAMANKITGLSVEKVKWHFSPSFAAGDIRVIHKSSALNNKIMGADNDYKITTMAEVVPTLSDPLKNVPLSRSHLRFDASLWGGDNYLSNGFETIGGVDVYAPLYDSGCNYDGSPFNWDLAQYLLSLPTIKSASTDNVWDAIISSSTGPKFANKIRRDDKGGFEIESKGNWVPVKDHFKGASACDITGAAKQCQGYIRSCLSGTSPLDGSPKSLLDAACVTQLRSMIAAKDAWKVTKDDIEKVSPLVAFRILKNLGFKGKQEKATGLKRVESVADWQKRVNDNELTDDSDKSTPIVDINAGGAVLHSVADIKAICKDDNFVKFLELIVGYIDSNPAILNAGATGKGVLSNPNDPFGLMRPSGNEKDGSLGGYRDVTNQMVDSMHVHVQGLMGALGVARPLLLLSGGGPLPGYLAPSASTKKLKMERLSEKLREVYNHYVDRLKAKNKTLSVQTVNKVDEVFDTLKQKEDELLKWVDYIERYYEITQLEGNNSASTISSSDLEDAYKKYEKTIQKFRKRTINLIDILSTLSNATNDAEKGSTVPLSV